MFKQFWVRGLSPIPFLPPVLWACPWQQNAVRSSADAVRKSGGEENELRAAQTPGPMSKRRWMMTGAGGWGDRYYYYIYVRPWANRRVFENGQKKARRKSISKAPGENNNFAFETKTVKNNLTETLLFHTYTAHSGVEAIACPISYTRVRTLWCH